MPLAWGRTIRRAAPANEEGPTTMNVTMLKQKACYPDGITAVVLEDGETYDLPERLATSFIENGIAEPATKLAGVKVPSTPARSSAPPTPDDPDLAAKVAAIAELSFEQLDELAQETHPDEITAAIAARRSELETPPAENPIDGMNAKNAAAAIAGLTLEQLDAIPDDTRKGVNDAIATRREELAKNDGSPD